MNSSKNFLFSLCLLLTLAGCHVPLQPYRLQHSVVEVPTPINGPSDTASANLPEKDCGKDDSPVCLTFIEVDDMGELFDKVEIDNALRTIRKANDLASSQQGADPIVITFVHGWKNNASETNDNVRGFKAALQEVYRRTQPRRVIGVYIGWRGDLVRSYFPVARQFSYFNREATAIRVPGATLSSALTQIATRTHENRNALAIYIGHSFGGLLLERTLSEATASQIAEASIYAQEVGESTDPQVKADKRIAARLAVDARADLVIFINPAGAATEAKQMLDFLTYNRYIYRPLSNASSESDSPAPAQTGSELDRPLFVSITSTADLATKVALPIGHSFPLLGFKSNGSFRNLGQAPNQKYDLSCFDPHREHSSWELRTKEEGAQAQSSYYMSTAPHMQVLQSHVMLKAVGANQMRVSSTGETIQIQDPNAIASCNRDLFNKQNLNIVSTFRLRDTQACFAVQERPNRCNGTPYWLMEIDPDVVPDHGTIFTGRLISFLIDTFFMMPEGQPLQRIHPQLTSGAR